MRGSKVVAVCIFNELQAVGLFLVFDGASMHTDGIKYCKSVNNAVFIRNESLFFVSAAAMSAFQLEHTSRLLRSICPGGYQIRTIEYGKILVMLIYGEYYGRVRVYKVYNKKSYASIDDFQMSIKRPTSGGQAHAQEAAVQQIFHLVRSSFFYL